jgi:hypothetical protein
VVFALLALPWFLPITRGNNTARLNQVSITSDPGIAMMIDEQRTFCTQELTQWLCYGFFNKPILIGLSLTSRYLSAFSAPFLVTDGEIGLPFLSVSTFGQFQFVLYPLFIIGLIALLNKTIEYKKLDISKLLLVVGVFTALLPALVSGEPQKVRLTPWWPFVIISMAYGWESTAKLFNNKAFFKLLIMVFTIALITFEGVRYSIAFTNYHAKKHDSAYQSYVPQIARFVEKDEEQALYVVKPFFSDPIMFLSFYHKLDPAFYQQHAQLGELEPSGFQHTARLNNWIALSIEPEEIACIAKRENYSKVYYITNNDYPELKVVERFLSSNGVLAYAKAYKVPIALCDQ